MNKLVVVMLLSVIWATVASAKKKQKPLANDADTSRAATAPTPAEVSKPGAQAATTQPSKLFNGWGLTPAGTHVEITAMPLKLVLSPDGQTLAGVCAAEHPGVAIIDVKTRTVRQFVPLPRAFNGICFSKDGKRIFATGGDSDNLHVLDLQPGGTWAMSTFRLAAGDVGETADFLTGIAVHPVTGKLYICNEGRQEVWVVDPGKFKREAQIPVGEYPHSCVFDAKGKYLFVSNWGARSVSVVDAQRNTRFMNIGVGVRPNDMVLAKDGRLFVACAGDNTIHVIRTDKLGENEQEVLNEAARPSSPGHEIISTSLYPDSPEGSTPSAVSLTPDEKTLLAVNSDNNDMALIDIADPKVSIVRGFIPTGWYPTSVATDGKTIFIGDGKGLGSRSNVPSWGRTQRHNGGTPYDYIMGVVEGWVSFIDVPDGERLAQYTAQVRKNSPYTPSCYTRTVMRSDGPIPDEVGKPCPIKYVLYIIKENRTYDQVLGDMKDASGKPIGNGDPKLVLFGDDVSPNHHQIARDYVLLDNLYCDSEVSLDGHSWCDAAIATDYRQRRVGVSYTGHGDVPGNKDMEDPAGGFFWDACQRHGLSFMCYGEGSGIVSTHNRGTWPRGRDPERAKGWIHDLHEAEKPGGELPRFMIMSLGEDHTKATQPGAFKPKACVASNDVALGMIVEAASHSRFWPEMAIFVIEDDAQNGPDHVDAHRTVGLVISPYVKRGIVDSTPYTTTSMVRTMELILGLPPMTQYDGAATPMFACFMRSPEASPYTLLQPKFDLNAMNRKTDPGAAASAKMDFDEYDEAPEDEMNRILWADVKGADAPYPAPIHRAFFMR